MLRSPLMDDESGGLPDPGRKPGGAGDRVGFEFSVVRAWKLNRAGVPAPPRKRLGAQALGIVFSGFRDGR